jgi:hypothetical protein
MGKAYWVIGHKSATEVILAATWRDSLWVPWFIFVAWLVQRLEPLRRLLQALVPRDEDDEDEFGA